MKLFKQKICSLFLVKDKEQKYGLSAIQSHLVAKAFIYKVILRYFGRRHQYLKKGGMHERIAMSRTTDEFLIFNQELAKVEEAV